VIADCSIQSENLGRNQMQFNQLLKRLLIVGLLTVMLLRTFAQDGELPDLVLAQREGFHPEGIVWDTENERFLTGSMTEGTIFAIADDGTVTPFIEDEALITTLGIHIDWEHDRLLVANADMSEDPEATGLAQLGIYDLKTGERLHLVDLGSLLESGHYLANGVTADSDGNAYVTDSFSPVIYKVTPSGEASILVESEKFSSETFGLNDIEYHPDGYLLVAFTEPGMLYKVSLDNPETVTQVELTESFSPDGIVLHPNGNLIVVATTLKEDGSPQGEVIEVVSQDDWASAQIVKRASVDADLSPTSVTIRGETPYVVHTHFNELFSGQSVAGFEILRIDFQE
jgi:sugar lactone lactonase YvrE